MLKCIFALATVYFVLLLSSCNESGNDKSAKSNNIENAKAGAHEPASNRPETMPTETDSSDDLSELLNSLETRDSDKRNQAVSQIENLARSDSNQSSKITMRLIREVKEICVRDSGTVSELVFQKVGVMSMILSDLQSIEALDALIDCSDFSRPVVTHPYGEGVTVAAIVNYHEKALPALKMKLDNKPVNKDGLILKCNISNMLSRIGGKEAERILLDARKNETDTEVLSCMRVSLNGFRNHK